MIVKDKDSRPLCRWCGRALPKLTHGYTVVQDRKNHPVDNPYYVQGPIMSREEAKAYVTKHFPGARITHYRFHGRGIGSFHTWDGESYWAAREFFCTNACAIDLGVSAARTGVHGPGYSTAIRKRRESDENVDARL